MWISSVVMLFIDLMFHWNDGRGLFKGVNLLLFDSWSWMVRSGWIVVQIKWILLLGYLKVVVELRCWLHVWAWIIRVNVWSLLWKFGGYMVVVVGCFACIRIGLCWELGVRVWLGVLEVCIGVICMVFWGRWLFT